MQVLGIDIGGSGIKGAPVEVKKGVLTARRFRIPTPQPSTPEAVAAAVAEITRHFGCTGPVGCTFPAVVKKGVVHSAANVDKSWIGVNGKKLLEARTGCPIRLLNDADAAGLAEMRFGAGRGHKGVVFVLTFGTGIGSSVFVNGHLFPNTELGHILLHRSSGHAVEAERYASDRARQDAALDWGLWAARVNDYLRWLEDLFSPDLFVIGGGVSKLADEFLPLLQTRAEILPARLRNEAGIVGAALAASSLAGK
jgi:polyphosphate glucokinase